MRLVMPTHGGWNQSSQPSHAIMNLHLIGSSATAVRCMPAVIGLLAAAVQTLPVVARLRLVIVVPDGQQWLAPPPGHVLVVRHVLSGVRILNVIHMPPLDGAGLEPRDQPLVRVCVEAMRGGRRSGPDCCVLEVVLARATSRPSHAGRGGGLGRQLLVDRVAVHVELAGPAAPALDRRLLHARDLALGRHVLPELSEASELRKNAALAQSHGDSKGPDTPHIDAAEYKSKKGLPQFQLPCPAHRLLGFARGLLGGALLASSGKQLSNRVEVVQERVCNAVSAVCHAAAANGAALPCFAGSRKMFQLHTRMHNTRLALPRYSGWKWRQTFS